MNDLQEFIKTSRDSREVKRALAVQNTLTGRGWDEVAEELGVKHAFIGKWRQVYARKGADGLRMGYCGSPGYLTAAQTQEVIAWVHSQAHWGVRMLAQEIERRFGIVYRSKQSYYALLTEARLSWKKTQKRNPQGDPHQIEATRQDIKKNS